MSVGVLFVIAAKYFLVIEYALIGMAASALFSMYFVIKVMTLVNAKQ